MHYQENQSTNDFDDLASKILAKREKTSNGFFSGLEAKYCGGKKAKDNGMPSEEEFLRIQAGIKKGKKK
jgi:hypothetical protein